MPSTGPSAVVARALPAALVLPVLAGGATAVLGESAAVPPLPGTATLPFALHTGASAQVVTLALAVSLVAAAAAVWAALRALEHGWAPSVTRLSAVGGGTATLLSVLPPLGSGDALSYAAYGRMVLLGADPWSTAPSALPGDPFADAVTPPWRDAPSVYGPLVTWLHALLVAAAGEEVRGAVLLLALVHLAAFLAVAGLLDRLASTSGPAARRRAALLWTANPLVQLVLVAGAHLEALVVLGVVAALALPRRRAASAGALAAAAALVKVSGGVAVLALLLARRPRGQVVVAASAVLGVGLLTTGPALLHALQDASGMVSRATPWRPLVSVLELVLPDAAARRAMGVGALALAVALGVALHRTLPDDRRSALRWGAVVVLAALLAAPYALPWYDGLGWALLAVLPASRADRWLLAHTALLALAHVPGRPLPLTEPLASALPVLASGLVPALLTVLILQVLRSGG